MPKKQPSPFAQILTVAEAAAVAGVSTKRINALYDQGRITGEKKGRDVLLLKSSVEEYARSERTNQPLDRR